ncbi:UDP-GalNAc:beta-1,3-N-acetylgalactosaminyltransferase 1-like [Symsagittifera roscoffensis]|uniref:UDP-GalNAc:beta-1, 3-N-acetylgalactosaminyltransferase 1-like n=1 Tax=Symsagittifera roscoffensis TaxID=84072 RepID=UPI00307BA943
MLQVQFNRFKIRSKRCKNSHDFQKTHVAGIFNEDIISSASGSELNSSLPVVPRKHRTSPFFTMPHFSQRFIMHVKSRLRCVLLILFVYFLLCIAIIQFPNPSHIEAIALYSKQEINYDNIPEAFKDMHEARAQTPPPASFFGKKISDELGKNAFYLIQNPTKCQNIDNKVNNSDESAKQVLIFVSSKPENYEARQAIRTTYAKKGKLKNVLFTVMFLIGMKNTTENKESVSKLEAENKIHEDMIVGNFQDNYRSMTSKTKMAFHWFVWNCPNADIVLKADDDVYIVYSNLYKVVANLEPVSIFGYCTTNRSFVSRNPRESSYVSYLEWSEPTVPRYCFGMAYGMDNYLAKLIYQTSSRINQFPLEDIFVGVAIEASKIRVRFEYLNSKYALHAGQIAFGLRYCNRKNSIAIHQLTPSELNFVHQEFTKGQATPDYCNSFPKDRLEIVPNNSALIYDESRRLKNGSFDENLE